MRASPSTVSDPHGRANVTDAELQKVVADKGHYAADAPIDSYSEKFISGWLIKYWPQILNLINADRTVMD